MTVLMVPVTLKLACVLARTIICMVPSVRANTTVLLTVASMMESAMARQRTVSAQDRFKAATVPNYRTAPPMATASTTVAALYPLGGATVIATLH